MNTIIVGMGALGLLFGDMITQNADSKNTIYLMDRERYERHTSGFQQHQTRWILSEDRLQYPAMKVSLKPVRLSMNSIRANTALNRVTGTNGKCTANKSLTAKIE